MVADRLDAVGLEVTASPDTGSLAGGVGALLHDFGGYCAGRSSAASSLICTRRLGALETSPPRSIGCKARTAPLLLSCSAAPSNAASCAAASIPKRAADRNAAPLCWHSIVIRGVTNDVYLDRLTAATLPAPRALQKPRLANRFAALHILGVVAV